MFKNKKDKDAAISLLTRLLLAFALNRRLVYSDVTASLRQLADDIDANNA
jgi:hypothetical protein